jgi:hypothetical protein
VCTKLPSGCNQQVLRYWLVTKDTGADRVLPLIKLGAALPELHLPLPGTEPEAFIVCCSAAPEGKLVDIDLGIALQSMALKAVEIGLNALIVKAFNKKEIKEALGLPSDPLAVLAIGKGTETIVLDEVPAGSDLRYYRDADGIHHVPKITVSDLLI